MSLSVIYEGPERYERQALIAAPYTVTLDAIIAKYRVRSAVDLGCGLGVDTAMMLAAGLDVRGLDGSDKLRPHLLFPADRYLVADLRDQIRDLNVDLIWCREVAEHLPAEHATTLVDNIVANCRVVYFTAAPPGQIGSGHINCQPRSYWKALFAARGFTVDDELTGLNQAHLNQDDRVNGMVLH